MKYNDRAAELLRNVNPAIVLLVSPLGDYHAPVVTEEERRVGWGTNGSAEFDITWQATRIVVRGWSEETDRTAYVTALHEIGHVATIPHMSRRPMTDIEKFGFSYPPERHAEELAAWRWAIPYLDSDTVEYAVAKSASGLRSYGVPEEQIAELHAEMRQSHQ